MTAKEKLSLAQATKEENDPAYQKQIREWDVTQEDGLQDHEGDRVGAEERLKNPARCLSGHELREQFTPVR
jgi:hypothetical protein